jgi:integrase
MSRKTSDASIESRTARGRLAVRHGPYFRRVEPGLFIGYRKLPSGPGTWIARRYAGGGAYVTENLRTPTGALVLADDDSEADGIHVMTFGQAQRAARPQRRPAGSITVGDVLDDYLSHLAARSARSLPKAEKHIRPALGDVKVSALTSERLRRWHDDLARSPRLTRGGGALPLPSTDDGRRARKASANRVLTVLKAALNLAFRDEKITGDQPWRRVKPFAGVGAARVRYLTIAESKRLLNACDANFRQLVRAALETGARYQEIARLRCHDFNGDAGTVAIRQSKSGKPRHVVLTTEGVEFFRQVCVGRSGDALIFTRDDGAAWGDSNQVPRMKAACARGRINPPIGFHGLRHSWASLAVMNGAPLMVVAKQLGHKDTSMVEAFYGHLSQTFITEAIRAAAPRFGVSSTNVKVLR